MPRLMNRDPKYAVHKASGQPSGDCLRLDFPPGEESTHRGAFLRGDRRASQRKGSHDPHRLDLVGDAGQASFGSERGLCLLASRSAITSARCRTIGRWLVPILM